MRFPELNISTERGRVDSGVENKTAASMDLVRAAETALLQRLRKVFDRLSPRQRSLAMATLGLFLLTSRAEGGIRVTVSGEPDYQTQEKEPPTKITPEMEELHRLLKELEMAGYSLNFVEGYTNKRDPDTSAIQQDQDIIRYFWYQVNDYLYKAGCQKFATDSPAKKILSYDVFNLELPVEARDTSTSINVPVYQIVSTWVTHGVVYSIVNWLNGQTVYSSEMIDSSRLHNPAILDDAARSMSEAMQTAMRTDLRTVSDQWKAAKDRIDPVEVRSPVYSFNEQAGEVEGAKDFFDQFEEVEVLVHSHPRSYEDANARRFQLTDQIIEQTQEHPLEVRGAVIQVIVFKREVPSDVDITPVMTTDSYGNVIKITYSPGGSWDASGEHLTQTYQHLTVYPKRHFLEETGEETGLYPIRIDLSQFGLGQLDSYFHQPVERPVMVSTDQAYRVYTTMDHATVQEEFGNALEQAFDSVSALERMYRFNPGSKVRQILIADAHVPSGVYSHNALDAITLFDETLRSDSTPLVATHEAQHRLSRLLSLENDVRLTQFHDTLSLDFFYTINENAWFASEVTTPVGHAQSNVTEFLSSFMNTLLDSAWQAKMTKLSPELRKQYAAAIDAFTVALQTRVAESDDTEMTNSIPSDAPLFQLLRERKMTLESF